MKKIVVFVMIMVLSVVFAGCSSGQYQELTEDQSNAIAQYCAYLILKYDKNENAERKLLDKKELDDYYKELEATKVPTPTAITDDPVVTPALEPTKAPTPVPTEEATPTPEQPKENKAKSLSELYDDPTYEIDYSGYNISKVYEENDYSSFSAKDGENLLSVDMKIKNLTSSKLKVTLMESDVEYYLYCENGDIYSPAISFLQNDMITLDTEIASGSSYDAVMIFCIKEGTKPSYIKAINKESGFIYDFSLD